MLLMVLMMLPRKLPKPPPPELPFDDDDDVVDVDGGGVVGGGSAAVPAVPVSLAYAGLGVDDAAPWVFSSSFSCTRPRPVSSGGIGAGGSLQARIDART